MRHRIAAAAAGAGDDDGDDVAPVNLLMQA